MSAGDWTLHPQLRIDTIHVGDLPLSQVLIIKDSNYPWLLLVPRRDNVSDIIDLNDVEQAQLITEINRVSVAVKAITKPDKLNIAALGNLVPQLHIHIIGRRKSDAAWPRPVWGAVDPVGYDPVEMSAFKTALRQRIWLD